MGALWYLLLLSAAVDALPNRFKLTGLLRARADASAPASEFCNVTSDGKTVVGVCTAETSVNSAGLTVISAPDGAITIPSGVSTPITTTFSNGDKTTITPSDLIIETTDAAGETVFSHGKNAITLSTGITTPIETVLPNGESTTITPIVVQEGATTTTNAAGQTIISNTDGKITLSNGVTTPLTTTFPDGQKTTITPTSIATIKHTASSSGAAAGIIVPVTTSVPSPTHTAGGVVVPCNYFWFFNLCPKVDDITVRGWFIETPTGVHPPGPPPSFKPDATLSFSIPNPLPNWPQWTLPPTGPPEASPKPNNCKTDTGDVCFYHTTFSPVTTNQATTTTSKVFSTCATVLGCDVQGTTTSTSTTASSTPTVLTYAVYPSDGTNQAQVTAIAAQLQKFVNSSSDIIASNTKTFGLNYWLLPLEESSVEAVRKVPNVASVYSECGLLCPKNASCDYTCYDPSIAQVYQEQYQTNGQDQLTYVSWARRQGFRPSRYIFDNSAGDDIPVYIVDNGATLSHQEFDLVRDKTQWIFINANPESDDTPPESKTDQMNGSFNYHGSAMLSLVTGKTVGVAKRVKPIVVRLPVHWTQDRNGNPLYQGYTKENWIDALGRVLDNLGEKHQDQATSVVLLATYFPASSLVEPGGFLTRAWNQIEELAKRGAVVVTGSGNTNFDRGVPIDGYPANFGKTNAGALSISSLIVAGAIWPHNEAPPFSGPTSGVPHVYAPGDQVIVADGNLDSDPLNKSYRTSRGTSDAAAMTAGLAAYFLKMAQLGRLNIPDRSPQGIKDFIIANSFSRFGTPRNVIFNAIDPTQSTCPWNPNEVTQRLLRRHNNAQCSTPSVPFVPLQKEPPVCHNEANFPGHADIHEPAVVGNADNACSRWTGSPYGTRDSNLGPNSAKLDHTYYTDGVSYEYSVEWIAGCTTTAANESVYAPTGSVEAEFICLGIWSDCYLKCNNGGVGGSIDVGCLRYTFIGGK